MAMALAEAGVDGRPLPRAAYLAGLAGVEGPERRVFMDPVEQRRRFLDAMGALIVEWGFPGPNIQDVSDRAEISRYAFIKHFTDIGDCFQAALIQAEADLRDQLEVALRPLEGFYARLRGAVAALVDFAAREPTAVRLVLAESCSEPALCLPGYGEEFATLRAWLAAQVGIAAPGAPGWVREEVSAGAVQTLLGSRLRSIEAPLDGALVSELDYFLVSALAGPASVGDWCGDGEYGSEVGDVVSW
jgi:AcrR family transcriptional regulator